MVLTCFSWSLGHLSDDEGSINPNKFLQAGALPAWPTVMAMARPVLTGCFYGIVHSIPIGSMYGIYANIWGILTLMVNVTTYGIHGSYGIYIYI